MQIALKGNIPECEAVFRFILTPFYTQALGRLSEFVGQDSDEEDKDETGLKRATAKMMRHWQSEVRAVTTMC